MRHVRMVTIEAVITRERVITDLPLVERTLNVPSDVDDDYESLRRAVLLDSENCKSQAPNRRLHVFGFVTKRRSTFLDRLTGFKVRPFSDQVVERVHSTSDAWLQQHLIDARVSECRALSAGSILLIRLEGTIGIP